MSLADQHDAWVRAGRIVHPWDGGGLEDDAEFWTQPDLVSEDEFERLHPRGPRGLFRDKPGASIGRTLGDLLVAPGAWPERGLAWQARWDALPDDQPVWLFHATTREHADKLLAGGSDPETKPRSLARERYEAGEYAVFQPGAGLGSGLSVGMTPWDVSGYGRQLLAVQVPKGWVEVSHEQAALGETSPGGALRVNDAVVNRPVPASAFREIETGGRVPGREVFDRLQEAFGLTPQELSRKAEHQLRDRFGRFRDEGLVPGVGRRAPGWMARDLKALRDHIEQRKSFRPPGTQWSPTTLMEVGAEVEKIAHRYSRQHEMRKRVEAINDEINDLFDKGYKLLRADPHPRPGQEAHQYLSPTERLRYDDLEREHADLVNAYEIADVRAYRDTLAAIRPMGGELRQDADRTYIAVEDYAHDELPELDGMLDDSLAEVMQAIPSDWIEDMNDKGPTYFHLTRKRAKYVGAAHHVEREDIQALGAQQFLDLGWTWLGTNQKGWPVLVRPEPDMARMARSDPFMEFLGYTPKGYAVFRDQGSPPGSNHLTFLPDGDIARSGEAPDDLVPEPPVWVVTPTGDVERRIRIDNAEAARILGDNYAALITPAPLPEPVRPSYVGRIEVDPRERGTLLHELGHRVEEVVGADPGMIGGPILAALNQFIRERRKGEPLRKLSEMTGSAIYRDDEVAFADQFFNVYVGKSYNGKATEVLSMGLQALFYPEWRRRLEDDPDMRRFILGILATQ